MGISPYKSGSGLTSQQQAALNNLQAPLKTNVAASAAPTVNDDTSKGYSAGSTWIYSGTTYTASSVAVGAAVWVNATDIYYFDDWTTFVAAINVAGSTYVNKFVQISNANGGYSTVGGTYTAPAALGTVIADGNGATYKVLAMGVNTWSIKLQQRPPAAFRVTSIQSTAVAKPTTDGYYIFKVTPSDGLPAGIALNDIALRSSAVWSTYQTYANADAMIAVGTAVNSVVIWKKMYGSWLDAGTYASPVKSVASSYNITANDGTIKVDCSGGFNLLRLPQSSTCIGQTFTVKKIDNSVNQMSVGGLLMQSTASCLGTTLTVTGISTGLYTVGMLLNTISSTTKVVAQLTGSTGSTGTYQLSTSQTFGSTGVNGSEPVDGINVATAYAQNTSFDFTSNGQGWDVT